MKYNLDLFLSLFAGAISGTIVLGIVGRIVTSGIAFIIGNPLNLSIKGIFEVIIVGLFVGGAGGVLLSVIKNIIKKHKLAPGIIVGLIMFVCTIVFGIITGVIVFDKSFIQFSIFTVVLVIFVIYGIFASLILRHFKRYWNKYL